MTFLCGLCQIVIKSANQSSQERARYEQSGADGAIDKVLTDDAFVRALGGILNGAASWRAPVVDQAVLGAMGAEEARERVLAFVERATRMVGEVSEHYREGDRDRAWSVAHRLKAAAGFVGATSLVQACEALRSLEGEDAWTQALDALSEATRATLEALPSVTEPDAPAPLLDSRRLPPDVVLLYRARSRRALEALRAAATAGESCFSPLHQLTGLSSVAGAERLAQRSLQLEQRAGLEASEIVLTDAELTELEALHKATLEALDAKITDAAPVALPAATPSAPVAAAAVGGLFIAGIDDVPLNKMMQEAVLFPALKADMIISSCIGETKAEQLGFFDFALGRVDKRLQPLQPPFRQADIIALDQNIDLDGQPHLLGTDLVVRLREAGFTGAACIISGGDPEEAKPGVDAATTKGGIGAATFVARLLEALARRRAEAAASSGGHDGVAAAVVVAAVAVAAEAALAEAEAAAVAAVKVA